MRKLVRRFAFDPRSRRLDALPGPDAADAPGPASWPDEFGFLDPPDDAVG
ncbi:MAG TPA: hypothetical protein VD866_13130 [Urbifossiella sp.]|nr:hypothetical protein [Urbifossiella sp.]